MRQSFYIRPAAVRGRGMEHRFAFPLVRDEEATQEGGVEAETGVWTA